MSAHTVAPASAGPAATATTGAAGTAAGQRTAPDASPEGDHPTAAAGPRPAPSAAPTPSVKTAAPAPGAKPKAATAPPTVKAGTAPPTVKAGTAPPTVKAGTAAPSVKTAAPAPTLKSTAPASGARATATATAAHVKAATVTARASVTARTAPAAGPTAQAPAAPAAAPAAPAESAATATAATAALPGVPQALTARARTLAGAVRRRCAELARMESPSGDARRLDALAEELTAGFTATGATARREPGPAGDHLVLEWPGEREDLGHLLVVGHHDTVWPVGTLADWPVEERDGLLSGPGVLDMKGGLALLEGAFALLADLGQRPHRPVRLVVVADEEIGSPSGRRVFERQLPGAAAVLGLEPGHPDGRLKTARRGSTRVRLTVTGREAHAGNDAAHGVSAVDELVDQLVAVRGLAQPGAELNTGRITGGTRANVIAGRAEAELGWRFATAEAQRRTLDTLAHLTALRPGAKVRAEVLSSRPAWPECSGNPLLRHVRSLAAVLGQQLDGAPAGGAGDTNLAGARGLPTLDGLGAVGAGPHARHEHLRIDQLAPRIALLTALLAVPLPRLRDRT
ncbi:M20/M25/M40 family metallo-hydrolase [Kitasatospora sp. NPDC048365]|uniref:M20/M25/M40 family metallo-hydrolase n=1 Tax=Kitasatospora sp. NPDC048365 TaxID=3364050 RepID=UPI00371C57CB